LKRIIDELATYFLVNGYEWNFDYGSAIPNEDDIERTIVRAKELLDQETTEHAQLEVGHLIFKKRAGKIDVFVHVGALGEDEEDEV
jgi:hypothetical protein